MKMTQFDELLRFYEERLMEADRLANYHDWGLDSIGVDKKSFLAQPAGKTKAKDPEPKLIECPHCGKPFYDGWLSGCLRRSAC
ncbi:hypothetical protein P4B35_03125 [Pontiellaceae bacterium B12227]|nr:hypothetical protein [Pontiellaceae bacterium B12227]